MRQKRGHISLNSQTKDALDSIKALGQSYDGVIQQLVKLWQQEREQHKASGNRNHGDNASLET